MCQCKCCTYDFLQVVSYLFTKLLVICSIVIDYFINELPPVVERWIALSIGLISIQWIKLLVSLISIHWIAIFPVDSAIQPLNDRGLLKESLSFVG